MELCGRVVSNGIMFDGGVFTAHGVLQGEKAGQDFVVVVFLGLLLVIMSGSCE